jgi:2-hydroxy-3-keto-5-methylthiopentenyl-1-phosphate phosphatase
MKLLDSPTTKDPIFAFDFDGTIFPEKSLNKVLLESIKPTQKKTQTISDLKNYKKGISPEKWTQELSLKRRLDIVSPLPEDIKLYIKRNKNKIEPIIVNLLQDLQKNNYSVFVVSLGYHDWISPILEGIIPAKNIFARKIKDPNQAMSVKNTIQFNKEYWINIIKNRQKIIMIGDGPVDFDLYKNKIVNEFIGVGFYYTDAYVKKNTTKENLPFFTNIKDFEKFIRDKYIF